MLMIVISHYTPAGHISSHTRKAPMIRSGRVRMRAAFAISSVTAALAIANAPASADAVSDFYTGKTVNLVIGYAPGGGYDLYARTLGRHIGRHIPGNPNIVVQNMPGAGSLKAANYLYPTAPTHAPT